jgi:hypothetical protein
MFLDSASASFTHPEVTFAVTGGGRFAFVDGGL